MSPRRTTHITAVLAALVAFAVVGTLLSIYLKVSGYSRILLLIGSTGFLILAVVRGGLGSRFGRLMTAGLFFCWLGDFLGPISFNVGVAAFLVAHIALTMAFWRHGLVRARILPTGATAILVSALILSWLLPYVLSNSRYLIVAYTAAITVMLGLALSVQPSRSRPWILSAAPVFYISDLIVARWAFVGGGSANAYFCYPLYYTACVLFACAIGLAPIVSAEPAEEESR